MYIPSNTNAPLFKEKGETHIDFTTSSTGLHLAGNYSYSDKYFVLLNTNYSYGNFLKYHDYWEASIRKEGNYNEFAHRYGEIGMGRYDILKSNFKLELMTGIGYGTAEENEVISDLNASADYLAKYYLGFVQTNIGYRNRFIIAGGGVRFAYTNFDYEYPHDYSLPLIYESINFYNLNVEPFVFAKLGKGKMKFTFKFNLSNVFTYDLPDEIDTNKGISYGVFHTTWINYSFGVCFVL